MNQKWIAELLFWITTCILTILILLPVYQYYGLRFPFYKVNFLIIVLFFTFSRYIFLLRYTPFSHSALTKVILLFSCIPLFLFCLNGLWDYQRYLDEGMMESIARLGDSIDNIDKMERYTRYEFIFFATGSLITLAMTPVRMIISIWKVRNKGVV